MMARSKGADSARAGARNPLAVDAASGKAAET
jgi:hypothetical protein